MSQYAILRRVPSKGVGVVLIGLRILILFFYPLTSGHVTPIAGFSRGIYWWEIIFTQIWLSVLGACPIRQPFVLVAQFRVLLYFFIHLSHMCINLLQTLFFRVSATGANCPNTSVCWWEVSLRDLLIEESMGCSPKETGPGTPVYWWQVSLRDLLIEESMGCSLRETGSNNVVYWWQVDTSHHY